MVGTLMAWLDTLASAQTEILWAGSLLIVVLIASVFVVRWIQKHWDPRRKEPTGTDGALTMEQIEAMRRGGRISDEEFAAMRRLVMKLPERQEESESNKSKSLCSDSIIVDSKVGRPNAPDGQVASEDV